MIDPQLVQKLSILHERKIEGIFKKYKLQVEKLDRDKSARRPDFLVQNSLKQKTVFECKYIASGGMTEDRTKHISTLDPDLPNSGVFQPDSLQKYWEVLSEAREQFLQLTRDYHEMSKVPFVVVTESDFFAWDFDFFVPKDLFGFIEISAIMRIEKNIEQGEFLKKFSLEDLEEMIEGKLKTYMPQPTTRFKVLLNSSPKIKFNPKGFLRNPIIV